MMDVLAMRKNTGEISGEIRLNGHLQEGNSVRQMCYSVATSFSSILTRLRLFVPMFDLFLVSTMYGGKTALFFVRYFQSCEATH